MVPPVQVSPLIKFSRYSALLVGIIYGKKRYGMKQFVVEEMAGELPQALAYYLKPIAEEERRIEEEEKKKREEMERIAKQLREATEDTILK